MEVTARMTRIPGPRGFRIVTYAVAINVNDREAGTRDRYRVVLVMET